MILSQKLPLFFDGTIYNFGNLDTTFGSRLGACGYNVSPPLIVLLLVNLVLLYVLVFKVKKTGDYLNMPYKLINTICTIGIALHMFVFIITTPSARHEETYFTIIFKGMFLSLIYFISYIVIIELFYIIKKKKLSYNDSYNTKLTCFDVVIIAFLIEIFLSFFYVTLDQRLVVISVIDGIEHKTYLGQFYMSQFSMILRHKNIYGLEGNVENYPYMIIILFLIIGQLVLAIFKPRFKITMITILSIINIVIMTFGLLDMRDSFYTNYIDSSSRNFFDLVGMGYYFIIGLNIAVLGVNLYSYNYKESIIIGVNEIEAFVNSDTVKKDIGYVIDDNKIEEINLEEGDDSSEVKI